MADYSKGDSSIRARRSEMASKGLIDNKIRLGTAEENANFETCDFNSLPKWLQDNDYLHFGYRPPSASFMACFKSIFRIHTETGNIWTHLLGCLLFVGITISFLSSPHKLIQWQDKLVFSAFFAGAILCLGMSATYHTCNCHSKRVARLFKKLDYCGIALLIMGSFVPWLYYGFYCDFQLKVIYVSMVTGLGTAAIIVSLWDKFGKPEFRAVRAGVFVVFGLSGVIPGVHHLLKYGANTSIYESSLGWILLMALLYIAGAMFYAMRFPERYFPGKCDICGQSHQIFHVFVVAAALVHYHGIYEMAIHRLSVWNCSEER